MRANGVFLDIFSGLLALCVLLAGHNIARASEQRSVIRIEDLEEIPREEWPDFSQSMHVSLLNGEGDEEKRDGSVSTFDYMGALEAANAVDQDSLSSPLLINDESFQEYRSRNAGKNAAARKLAATQTADSHICKRCIDADNRWCPTSNYGSGYCCDGADYITCPNQGQCSDDFSIREL